MNHKREPAPKDEAAEDSFTRDAIGEVGRGLADGAKSVTKWTVGGILGGAVVGFLLVGSNALVEGISGTTTLLVAFLGAAVGAVVGGGIVLLVFLNA